jgi:glycosyltransferase involved in cell wall biosynthesis
MADSPPITASVIIPCRGHSIELRTCLTGLLDMQVETPFEIIVVDSANDPKVWKVVEEFKGVNLVKSTKALNAASARNLGVLSSSGEFLAFIDADCIPDGNWLHEGINALKRGGYLISGPILDSNPLHPILVSDNLLQFVDFSRNRRNKSLEYVPGCNLIVPQKVFNEVGGFPDFDVIEDVLFSRKIISQWPDKCWYIPELVICHKGRTNFLKMLAHQFNFGYLRGIHKIRITDDQQKLGAIVFLIPGIALKRLSYILGRIVELDKRRLPMFVLFLPIIVAGLLAWAIGFHQGCKKSTC